MTIFQLKMGGWQTDGTADLWAGRVVARRFGFPSPASWAPRKDVRFAHSSQPAEEMRAASRVGFPSPPRVSRPKETIAVAICGAAGPNLWPRHLLLFMRWLLAAKTQRGGGSCIISRLPACPSWFRAKNRTGDSDIGEA
jgi:hypothetical protein